MFSLKKRGLGKKTVDGEESYNVLAVLDIIRGLLQDQTLVEKSFTNVCHYKIRVTKNVTTYCHFTMSLQIVTTNCH